MRKINKIINIALIFMLIGAVLCHDLYALRIPMTGYKKVDAALDQEKSQAKTAITHIKKALETLRAAEREAFDKPGAATEVLHYARRLFATKGSRYHIKNAKNLSVLYLLMTHRCPLEFCKRCYMKEAMLKKKDIDMPMDIIEHIALQMHDYEEIYLSGGEPFAYYKKDHDSLYPTEEFWQALEVLSKHAGKVTIDTNGFWLLDKDVARTVAERLPRNVELIISADPQHEDIIKKRFKTDYRQSNFLKRIEEVGLKIGKNVFFAYRDLRVEEFTMYYGRSLRLDLDKMYQYYDSIGIRDVISKKTKMDNIISPSIIFEHASGNDRTSPTRLISFYKDYLEAELPWKMFLFVTPTGEVTINSYAASISRIPEFCLMGDVNKTPLSQILFEGIFSRFINLSDYPELYLLWLSHYLAKGDGFLDKRLYDTAQKLHARLNEVYGYRAFDFIFKRLDKLSPSDSTAKSKSDFLIALFYFIGIYFHVSDEAITEKMQMCKGIELDRMIGTGSVDFGTDAQEQRLCLQHTLELYFKELIKGRENWFSGDRMLNLWPIEVLSATLDDYPADIRHMLVSECIAQPRNIYADYYDTRAKELLRLRNARKKGPLVQAVRGLNRFL